MVVKGKVFIITGASSGIGEELSKKLSKKGASVVCAARSIDKLEKLCTSIINSGGSALPVQTDITDQKQCHQMVKKTIQTYNKIDGLILNAGISMWARFDEIKDVRFFETIMNTNYLGAVFCVHEALPYLKKSKGKIISCSTGQALMGFPNHSGYVASKHALHGFLSTIKMENKNEVSVLEAVLSWIRGTNLRGNSYGPQGKTKERTSRKHTKESVSLNACVSRIIKGIEQNETTIYVPKKLALIPFLKVFFEGFLEKKVVNAINKNKK